MTSRKSYFNLNLFKESVKQQKYIVLLHTIFLFLCTTLPAIITKNNASALTLKDSSEDMANMLSGFNPLLIPLVTAAAVITAIFLFNYLYKQQSVLFYHSMEHSRECIYVSRFLSGVFTLILPLIPLYVINTIVYAAIGISEFVGISIMLKGFLAVALMYICVFAVSCFAASVSGNFFAQLGMIAFVFLAYIISTAIIQGSFEAWFSFISIQFGYGEAYIFPPMLLAKYAYDTLKASEIIYVAVYTAVFAVAGLVLYKYRKSESTGKFFAYGKLTSFLKYYIAFFAALCLGLIFSALSQRNMAISLFGYLIGAFLAFIILQGIFGKNFKAMFENMRGFAILAVCTLIVAAVPLAKPEIFYIMPNADRIHAIDVHTSGNGYYNDYTLTSKENILSVLNLAEKSKAYDASSMQNRMDPNDRNKYFVAATVNPDNGVFSIRYSFNASFSEYDSYMKSIYDTAEYKNIMLKRINIKDSRYSWIDITRNTTYSINIKSGVNNSEEVKELLNIFRKEYGKYTYDDINGSKLYATINVNGNNYRIYECYADTVKFIKEKYKDNIEFSTDGLLELTISRYGTHEPYAEYEKEEDEIPYEVTVTYTAEQEMDAIEKILSESIEVGAANADIRLVYNNGNETSMSVNTDNYSHEVKELLLKKQAASN